MKILWTLTATLWRALLHTVPTMIGILLINFLLLQLAPGDAADVVAGESGSATQESLAALRSQFGLDQSIGVQLEATQFSVLTIILLALLLRFAARVRGCASIRQDEPLHRRQVAFFRSLD